MGGNLHYINKVGHIKLSPSLIPGLLRGGERIWYTRHRLCLCQFLQGKFIIPCADSGVFSGKLYDVLPAEDKDRYTTCTHAPASPKKNSRISIVTGHGILCGHNIDGYRIIPDYPTML